jgi:hypothetical protein
MLELDAVGLGLIERVVGDGANEVVAVLTVTTKLLRMAIVAKKFPRTPVGTWAAFTGLL